MMWQPIESAWTMFSTSRGLAQISSTCGRRARSSSADAIIGTGSRPVSAMRPAKTETYPPGPPASQSRRVRDLVEGHQRRDVQLDAVSARARRTDAAAVVPSVFVTGILT